MSKNVKSSKNLKIKLISFWTLIGLFTVAFVAIVVMLFIESRPFEDYDDIKKANLTLVGSEIFDNKKASDYFVYIYTSDLDNNKVDTFKAEELKPIIFNYFNFVKLNSRKSGIVPIFGFDVRNYNNRRVVGNTNSSIEEIGFENFKVNEADLPMLLRVSDGSIQSRYITSNDIQKSLQTVTTNVTSLSFEMVLPKKEELFS